MKLKLWEGHGPKITSYFDRAKDKKSESHQSYRVHNPKHSLSKYVFHGRHEN